MMGSVLHYMKLRTNFVDFFGVCKQKYLVFEQDMVAFLFSATGYSC
jgi:hypothetical protein